MLRKQSLSSEEIAEVEKSIELADLAKPMMRDGLDLSLFTQKEIELMQILEIEHDEYFRKRAEKLRFYPDVLNCSERQAILRCMTYEEMKPFYKILSIEEKNRRLQTLLTRDKVELRRYCEMTKNFVRDPDKKLPNVSIAEITEKYFQIMNEKDEKVYEFKYYFLSDDEKKQITEVYSKSFSKNDNQSLDAFAPMIKFA